MPSEEHLLSARTWEDRLRGLAALLPLFEKTDADYGEAISALNDVAYRLGWVVPDFDWPSWGRGPECQRLVQHPAEVAAVDAFTLALLLTAHLRQDRFCEGHLSAAYEAGHLAAIVQRAAALAGGLRVPDGP